MTDSEKEERYDRILDTLVDQFMQRDNSLIKSPHNKTKYKGVTQSGEKRFTARLTIKGSHSHLGTFETAEDAAYAYKKAVLKEKFFAEMIKATCKRVKELPRIPQKDEEKDEGEEEVDLSKAMDGVKLMDFIEKGEKEEANGDSWAKIEADAVADDEAVQLMIDENAELKAENAELKAENAELKKASAFMKEKDEEDEDEDEEDEEEEEEEEDEEIKEARRAMCQRVKELLLIAKSRSGKPEDTHALWKKLMREDEEHTAYRQKLWALVAKAKARSVALQEKIELEKLAEHPMVKQLWAENAALKKELAELKPESEENEADDS